MRCKDAGFVNYGVAERGRVSHALCFLSKHLKLDPTTLEGVNFVTNLRLGFDAEWNDHAEPRTN